MNSNRLLMIHPGRILLEEFLAPKESASGTWPKTSAFRSGAFTKSSKDSVLSPPTSPIAWRITSVCRNGTGSICKRGTMGREKISYRRSS
jgi:hypothetical protein